MTNQNKNSIAKETVYDRCAYVGCYNGKFINGRRLFHFPAETDRRLEMWIERSGNFRLRTWAATSLRKAGLCGDHFDEKSFTNATRKALKRNVVPRHYTEDLKYRKAMREKLLNNETNRDTIENENPADSTNRDVSSLNLEFVSVDENRDDGIYHASLSQSEEYGLSGNKIKTAPRTRSPSPVVEYIVEELDENLIGKESELTIEESKFKVEDNDDESDEDEAKERTTASPRCCESINEADESTLEETYSRAEETVADSQTYELAEDGISSSNQEESDYTRVELPWEENRVEITDAEDRTVPTNEIADSNSQEFSRTSHEKTLHDLRNENKYLRKTMRSLKQNLRRSKAREANYKRARDMLKNVDEFLDIQECTNPAARAMVKLALRRPKAPYTHEERDFAIKLYRNSLPAYVNLRRYGCNLPGKSTMKRWIAEECGERSTDDLTIPCEGQNNSEEVRDCAEEAEVYCDESNANVIETGIEIDSQIVYIPETFDHLNGVVQEFEVPVDEIVEQFEVQMEDTETLDEEAIHEEYMTTSPGDVK